MWMLFLFLGDPGGAQYVNSFPFQSEQACERAKVAIEQKYSLYYDNLVMTICVKSS